MAYVAVFALVTFVLVGLINSVGVDLPNLPNPFDNSQDGDHRARGSLRVEGQSALTATDSLVVKIGEGEATVAIKADQNWDRPGGPFSLDFQGTNGTASVRDPEDNDQPATIVVGVEYCSQGEVTRRIEMNSDGEPQAPEQDEITYDMGALFVCDVEWLPTAANEAAFNQDDTPEDFQGAFEELIKSAAIAAVAASECPDTLIESYTDPEYLDFVAEAIAARDNVPVGNIEVRPGSQGATSAETEAMLRRTLEDFVATEDLDIDAFTGSGRAIDDSCFVDTRGQALDSLSDITVPDPRDEL